MNIAILGTRGIPANYGGFETFAEELSSRLVLRGHQVSVYGRTNAIRYTGSHYKGARIVLLPTIPHKYFDTVAHTFLSVFHILPGGYDAVLICNAANSIFSFIPRLAGMKTVVNVDGLERHRRKWNALGKAYYLLSEWLSTWLPNEIVTDARTIENYYETRYGRRSHFIPYGADTERVETTTTLQTLGLEPQQYFLYVSRMEPENNALLVVKAFEKVQTRKKLLMVGSAPYASEYIRKIQSTEDSRILFPGGIYGDGYRELKSHAFGYIHATEVGGTHPALIEAMGAGLCVLYLDTPENREVAGDAGIPFSNSADSLAEKMKEVLENSALRADCERRALERVRERYRWEDVTAQYEHLFSDLTGKGSPRLHSKAIQPK